MEITFLGTGSAYPSPHRGTTSYTLRMQLNNDSELLLFDVGEGTQTQLMKSKCKSSRITRIFITHLHGDHIFGLPGLLCTISMQMRLEDDSKVIELYGPRGIKKFVRTSLLMSRSELNFKLRIHEMHFCSEQLIGIEDIDDVSDDSLMLPCELAGSEISPDENNIWKICEAKQFNVVASWTQHRIPCFGYVITENDRPGKLDSDKLKQYGIPPGPIYQQIKNGTSITLESGVVINAMDVTSTRIRGRKVAILGDTCAALVSMRDVCQSCDLIVHEATLEDDMREKAILNGHSTPEMAGDFARHCHAKQLVISHFSQRYRPQSDTGENEVVSLMVQQAKDAFRSDRVMAAVDLMSYDIKP